MHTHIMADDTSPIDQNAVSGVVHVISVSVSDARRDLIRIPEITHVLPKKFELAHLPE
jgi:hypothetical protein